MYLTPYLLEKLTKRKNNNNWLRYTLFNTIKYYIVIWKKKLYLK